MLSPLEAQVVIYPTAMMAIPKIFPMSLLIIATFVGLIPPIVNTKWPKRAHFRKPALSCSLPMS